MAGYSDTEVENAVSQFVKNTVTIERDPLGPVKQDLKYNEVIELFSSSLIFDPNAIFYLVFLASNRLNTKVISVISDVDDLLDAISEMSFRTTEVVKTSLLGEAATALQTADLLLTQRKALNSAAFSRYLTAVDSFADASLAPNIRQNGDINRPPQKARTDARTLLASLSSAWDAHRASLEQIQGMLDAFIALDLPVLTIQDSLRKVRLNIQAMQATFEDTSTTRDDKIAEARDAYLDLAAGKSILSNYLSVTNPSAPRMESSSSLIGRTALPAGDGEFEAASVQSTISAPWIVETGVNDELSIEEDDSATPTLYTIVPPEFPSVQSYLGGAYDIHAASAATLLSTNTENFSIPAGDGADFQLAITDPALSGLVTFSGTLTSGTRTAAQVATDIGNLTDGSNPLSTYVDVVASGGAVRLTHKTSGLYLISIGDNPNAPIPSPNVNTVVGFAAGTSDEGTDANNLLEIDGLSPRITLTAGTRTRVQIAADINTWATANYPEYSASDDGAFVTIAKETAGAASIRISADDVGDRDTILAALDELGFYEGQTDSAEAVTAAEVARLINDEGKIAAEVSKTAYESGEDGVISGSTLTVGSVQDGREGTLYIRSGANAGAYPILSVIGGAIVIDGTFPVATADPQSWAIIYEVLTLSSKSTGLDSQLIIYTASANATLGLTAGTSLATTTGFRAADSGVDQSFVQADVVEGDVLRRVVGASTVDHEVIEVSDDKQLEIDPPLSIDAAIQFKILSIASIAHETFQEDVTAWQGVMETSSFSEDLQELDRVMNPLLTNKNPTAAQVGDAETAANELRVLLVDLQTLLEDFVVSSVGRIDAGLRMLQERGLDRSYDTLLNGDITSFFGYDKDDASLASYMLKTTRSVVQSDLRISKLDEDADDIIHDELITETDAEFDFSDVDSDEKFNPVGVAADVSAVDEDILKIRL